MEPAFQVLFDRYGDLVFGYCMKLIKDREQAEDASQDVWVKVIKNAKNYKSQGKFKAWLLQITRNTCFSLFRDLKKGSNEDISAHEVEDVSQNDILDLISREQSKQQLKKSINELPQQQRLVLVIWMTEEMSYQEIANEMSLSVSSVKSLLFRGRENLKTKLRGSHG